MAETKGQRLPGHAGAGLINLTSHAYGIFHIHWTAAIDGSGVFQCGIHEHNSNAVLSLTPTMHYCVQ